MVSSFAVVFSGSKLSSMLSNWLLEDSECTLVDVGGMLLSVIEYDRSFLFFLSCGSSFGS